jgi:aldose 1-epimerase
MAGDEDGATVLLSSVVTPKPGYPFTIELQIRFTLDASGLSLDTAMRNAGDRLAPCFFGWHPYFRIGAGHCDTWELQVPAQTVIRADDKLIALPGAAAYVALDDAPDQDFRRPKTVGTRVIDYGFTDLQADADGRIRTRLRDPDSGLGIAVWQERGIMHAFTGDTVSRPRQSIALEPMECMANAFNREDCAEAISLAPGETRHFRCGVEVLAP